MPDRERVVEELEHLSEWLFHQYQIVYDGDAPIYYDAYKTVDDALELLKEQDAVEPIPPTDESDLWKCGNCNHQIFRCKHQRYCEMCGKPILWEGR